MRAVTQHVVTGADANKYFTVHFTFVQGSPDAEVIYMRSELGYQLELVTWGALTGVTGVSVTGPQASGISGFALDLDTDEFRKKYPSDTSYVDSGYFGDYSGQYTFTYSGSAIDPINVDFQPGTPMALPDEIVVDYPNVSWGTVAGAVKYYVKLYQSVPLQEIFHGEDSPTAQTQIDISPFMTSAPDGDYKVQVVAVDAQGNEAYSLQIDFSIVTGGTGILSGHYYDLDSGGWVDKGEWAVQYIVYYDGTNLNTNSPMGTIYDEGTTLTLDEAGISAITETGRTESAEAVAGHVYSIVYGDFKLLLKTTEIIGDELSFEFFVGDEEPVELVNISGKVIDLETGSGIDNITVQLHQSNFGQTDTVLDSTTTGTLGSFTISNVNRWQPVYFKLSDSSQVYADTYTFVYFPDELSSISDLEFEIVKASIAVELGLTADQPLVIGWVEDKGGNEYAGAEISIMSMTPGVNISGAATIYLDANHMPDSTLTSTSTSGSFVITNLPSDINLNVHAFDPADWNRIFMGHDARAFAGAVTIGLMTEMFYDPGTGSTIDIVGNLLDYSSTFMNQIPAEGVTVKLNGEDDTTATSGAAGMFTISVDTAVSLFLTMDGSALGYLPLRTWQMTPDRSGAYTQPIAPILLATSEQLGDKAPGTSTGTVYGKFIDDFGDGIAGVSFTLENDAATSVAISDSSGGFVFGGLLPGDYELNYFGGSFLVAVDAGTVTTGPVLFSGGGGGGGKADISGEISYGTYDGDAIATLWSTSDYSDGAPITQTVTLSAGKGSYTFTNVDVGDYFVSAELAGVAVGSYKPGIKLDSSGRSNASFSLKDLYVGDTVKLMGRLFNPFMEYFDPITQELISYPVQGLTVYLAGGFQINGTSDENGEFTISGVPAGEIVTLIVQGPGYASLNTGKFKTPTVNMSESDIEIPVIDEQFVNGILWNFPGVDFDNNGIIMGRAGASSGESLSGTSISIDPPSGSIAYNVWGPDPYLTGTSEDGMFALYNISPGNYNLYGDKAGYEFSPFFTNVYPGTVAIGEIVGSPKAASSADVQSAIDNGLAWLAGRQDPVTGAFGTEYMLGVTELAALTFMNHGHYAADNAAMGALSNGQTRSSSTKETAVNLYGNVVSKAINLILNQQDLYDPSENEYGAIYEQFTGADRGYVNNYTTAIGILALATADRHTSVKAFTEEIMKAAAYLVRAQNGNNAANNAGYQETDPHFGGWGYGWPEQGWEWADLSNTQWVLLGLDAAKRSILADSDSEGDPDANDLIDAIDAAFDRSMVFLQRCQNLDLVNDMTWAGGTDDGGFIYNPDMGFMPEDAAMMMHSYGAMTYAGIWSYYLNGLTPDDPRMARALGWAADNFAVSYHAPWMGDDHSLYYYYLSLAKALTMVGKAAEDVSPSWYPQLAAELVGRQRTDGYWVNFNPGEGEGIKELCTAYALLSLATQRVATDGTVTVLIDGSQTIELTVPETKPYTMTGISGLPIELTGEDVVGGVYRVDVKDSAGEYTLTIQGSRGEVVVSSDEVSETLGTDEIHRYHFVVAAIEGFATELLREIPNSNIPFIILMRPEEGSHTTDDAYIITWIDGGFTGDATIHLFSSADGSTYSEITDPDNGLKKDGENYFEWNTSDPALDGGSYTIKATIEGGADYISNGSVLISQDGMPRAWEETYDLNVYKNDAGKDPDDDGLTNAEEYAAGTNPKKKDTDEDGIPDKYEIDNELDPLVPNTGDTDEDGSSDLEEYRYDTDPNNSGSKPDPDKIIYVATTGDDTGDGTEGDPYKTISKGIAMASGLNTVQVAPGTYKERITLKNGVNVIGWGGSDDPWNGYVIDGEGMGDVVTAVGLNSGKIKGFAITNSGSRQDNENLHPEEKGKHHRFGVYVDNSTITISHCMIEDNQRGIGVYGSSRPLIRFNVVAGNSSDGIFFRDAHSNFEGDELRDYVVARNNTIWKNGDAGVKIFDASPVIFNNIIANNSRGIDAMGMSDPRIKYNDVYMNNWGIDDYIGIWNMKGTSGNISRDPLFVSTAEGSVDLHLQPDSPCIDSGRPVDDFPAWIIEPYPGGWGDDMGALQYMAYGFRIASKPVTTAAEGQEYTYAATVEGMADGEDVTFTLPTAPAGMTVYTATVTAPANATLLTWTAGYRDAHVQLVATGSESGPYTQTFNIEVAFNDVDQDDLPDTWENEYWSGAWDNTADTTSGADPDEDSYTNRQELIAGLDPMAYDTAEAITSFNLVDYYPLNQGNTWTYESRWGSTELYTEIALVDGSETVNGTDFARIAHSWGVEYRAVTANGMEFYKEIDFSDDDPEVHTPPVVLIPAQLTIGQTYSITSAAFTYTLTVMGVETVTVPAGTFQDCLKVEVEVVENGHTEYITEWFAPGVGLVRDICEENGETETEELVSYYVNGVAGGDNPSTGTISGSVFYDGTDTNLVHIGIFDDMNMNAAPIYSWTIHEPGKYKVPVATGAYYIGAYMDVNLNHIRENFEPSGAFGMPDSINVMEGFDPEYIDIWISEQDFIDPGATRPTLTMNANQAYYDFDFNMYAQESDVNWDIKYDSGRLYANTGGSIKDWGPVDYSFWDTDPAGLDHGIGSLSDIAPMTGNLYTLEYTSDFGNRFVAFRVTSITTDQDVTFEFIYDFIPGPAPGPMPGPGVGERSITGRVTATDKPDGVDGWWIDAWSESTGSWGGSTTDENGYYTVTNLAEADDFVVAAWPPAPDDPGMGTAGPMPMPEYQPQFYNLKDNWDEADRVSTTESDAEAIDFVLSKGLSITGLVHDGSESGIAYIWVDAYADSVWFGMGTMTDEAGNYTITGLKPAEDYRVQVWSDTVMTQVFYMSQTESTPMWDQATRVDVRAENSPVENIDIIVSEGASIEGYVYRADRITPVANVWVNAWSDGLMIGNGSMTDERGYYKIVGLTEVTNPDEMVNGLKKSYVVDIWAPEFPYQAYDGASNWEDATRVTTGSSDINFYLSKGAGISGKVEDVSGAVMWVWVEAWSPSTGGWGGANSGQNKDGTFNNVGGYHIANLPPANDYVVSVWPPDYPGQHFVSPDVGTQDMDKAKRLDLTRGDRRGINFLLSKGKIITGVVTVNSGADPVPSDVWVDVWSEATITGGGSPVGPDGRYEIAGLDADATDYIISVWHPDFLPTIWSDSGTVNIWEDATGVPASDPGNPVDRNLDLSSGKSIKGKVTLNGRPIGGIWIDAWSETGGWGGTETKGFLMAGEYNYVITGLPPLTDYQVTIYPENYASQTYESAVDVSLGDEEAIDFVLTVGRKISGTITGLANGKEVWVNAWSQRRGFGNGTNVIGTGGDVDYEIKGLKPAPDYKVDIYSPDYTYQAYNGQTNWDKATLVPVTTADADDIDFALSAGVTISGDVTFPARDQEERAWIDAWSDLTGTWGGTEVIAAAGDAATYTYVINGLTSTTDYVVAVWSNEYKNVFYDNVSNWENASKIDTSDSLKDNDVDFTLSAGARISGKVTSENGDGVSDMWVDAWSESTGSWGGAVTETDGTYTIVGVDAATDFKVAAWKENAPPFFYHVDSDGGIDTVRKWERAASVSTVGGNATDIDIMLSEGGTISGTVRNTDGRALGGIWVDAWSDAQQAGSGTFTRPDGSYKIEGLPKGNDYTVSVWPDPSLTYIPQEQENISTGDAVVFNLNSGYTISGTVRNNSGTVISDVWIDIWSHSKNFYGWAETDSDGKYSIGGLPAAVDYVIMVEAPVSQAYVPYHEKDISISADTDKDITLLTGLSISGHVYTSDGETGVADVRIIAFSASMDFWAPAKTDSQGAYEFENTPNASDYEITAIPADYAEQTKADQSAGSTVDFTLETGGSITGTVKDISGVGIDGVWVEASSASVSLGRGGAITDEDGKFEIGGLRSTDSQGATLDDYVVTVGAEGYPPQSQGGKSVGDSVTFTLTAGDANKISGTVRDSSGDTVFTDADDQITLMQVLVFENVQSGGIVTMRGVNNDGTFEVTGLTADTEYQLKFRAYKTGYEGEYVEWCGSKTGDYYQGSATGRSGATTVTTGTSLGSVDFQFSKTWAGFWQ